MLRAVIAVCSTALLVGCGGSAADDTKSGDNSSAAGSTSSAGACQEIPATVMDAIAEGLRLPTYSLGKGQAVPLPPDEGVLGATFVAAVHVKNGDATDTATLALGSLADNPGPINATDAFARLYFTWGEAAQEGSKARESQDALFQSASASSAAKCLE